MLPERVEQPTQYASGYTLDLYCDHENAAHEWAEFPHQFVGENFGRLAKAARRRGWIIRPVDRTATCPKCSGKNKPAAYIKPVGGSEP